METKPLFNSEDDMTLALPCLALRSTNNRIVIDCIFGIRLHAGSRDGRDGVPPAAIGSKAVIIQARCLSQMALAILWAR